MVHSSSKPTVVLSAPIVGPSSNSSESLRPSYSAISLSSPSDLISRIHVVSELLLLLSHHHLLHHHLLLLLLLEQKLLLARIHWVGRLCVEASKVWNKLRLFWLLLFWLLLLWNLPKLVLVAIQVWLLLLDRLLLRG